MAGTVPTFGIAIADFSSTSDRAVGGPVAIVVDRDMDVPADGLEVRFGAPTAIDLGVDVTVELGYESRTAVFTGEVAEVVLAVPGVAVVRAVGTMAKLLRARKAATYEAQSAGDIVRDLLGAAGVDEGIVSDGPTLPRFAIDARASAHAHIRGLADRLGYEFYATSDGKINFRALGAAANLDAGSGLGALASAAASAVGTQVGGGGAYAYAKQLVAVAARRGTKTAGTLQVGGESPMSSRGESTSYWLNASETDPDGSAGDGDPRLQQIDPAARTTDLAARFAAGYLATRNRRANEVRISVLGRASVELGDSISVTDVPGEPGGLSGYVRAIRHTFDTRTGFVSRVRIALEDAS